MARFQALTNRVLDEELELVRDKLGLAPSQKAELLREIAAIAAWTIQQTELGRIIEARRGEERETLKHPALERLREVGELETVIYLSNSEVERLAEILNRPFTPTPALRRTLEALADPNHPPPTIRWRRSRRTR